MFQLQLSLSTLGSITLLVLVNFLSAVITNRGLLHTLWSRTTTTMTKPFYRKYLRLEVGYMKRELSQFEHMKSYYFMKMFIVCYIKKKFQNEDDKLRRQGITELIKKMRNLTLKTSTTKTSVYKTFVLWTTIFIHENCCSTKLYRSTMIIISM